METYTEREEGIRLQVRENGAALVCGVLAVTAALFIPLMRLLYPSAQGGGALLYLPVLCILFGGGICLMLYCNRKVLVEDMNICYVNLLKKEKRFTLDEIGFCKVGVGGSVDQIVLCDLRGEKLCKLDFEMRGMAEFYQYLVDNGVETAWAGTRRESVSKLVGMLRAIGRETAVCEEEIGKCAEDFLGQAERIFREWEAHNAQFEAVWEIGYAEYTVQDMERSCRPRERVSSVHRPLKAIPESYECVLEAYLKREDGYVVNARGEEIVIVLPYLAKTKSYRVGEGTRIRKTDEDSLTEWLTGQLAALTDRLPRRRYHTEHFTLRHELRAAAGLQA